jgi:hypothetical protein
MPDAQTTEETVRLAFVQQRLVGRADFHGRWIEWIGWPGLH